MINDPKTQLRVVNKTKSFATSLTDIANSNIKVYWGPNQQFSNDTYQPPSGWPRAGLLYRMLNVCRVLYQSADLDVEAFFVQGPAGTYQYKVFENSLIFNDISNDPTIFSGHINVTYPFPYSTPGEIIYGVQFHGNYSGHSATPDLTVSGQETTTFQLLLSPSFSYNDYLLPGSPIAGAIEIAVGIAGARNSASPPPTQHVEGAPPYDITFDGPNGTGIKVLKTGNIFIDDMEYSDDVTPPYPPTQISLPHGYKEPIPVNYTIRDQQLSDGFSQVAANLKEANRNTYPYFGVSNLYQPGTGINAPPTYQFFVPPDETNWLGTNTVNVFVACKPHTPIPSSDIEAIKATYAAFRLYRLIIYIDDAYMLECNMPNSVVIPTINLWTNFCAQLSDYGVILGGLTSQRSYYFGGSDIPTDVQNAIFTLFPTTGPNTPTSYDPPQDSSSIGPPTWLLQKRASPTPDVSELEI